MSRANPPRLGFGRRAAALLDRWVWAVRRLALPVAAWPLAAAYVLACLAGPVPRSLLVGVFVPLTTGFEWGLTAVAGRTDRDRTGDGHRMAGDVDVGGRRDVTPAIVTAGAVVAAAVVTTVIVVVA